MKKSFFSVTVFLAVSFLLTGCHIKHEWIEATCTEPRICAAGGETEGEALGHDWQEATCSAPRTCSRCGETQGEALAHNWVEATCTEPKTCTVGGETEGDALGHTWVEADYVNPKTCSVCGETEGDALIPSFVEHGITNFIEEGQTYDYVAACYSDKTRKTTGHLTISDCRTFVSDDTHEARDGYEWHALHVSILFNDVNAWDYGMTVGHCFENYYDIESWDESFQGDEETRNYTVQYEGQDADCLICRENIKFGDWSGDECTFEEDYYVQIPVGYDGVVLGFRDSGVEWGEDQHIYDVVDENTLFFRIQ
jgi:hypothetical protein